MSKTKTKKQKSHKKSHSKTFRRKKFIKITLIYFVLFTALLSMVDYYALMVFNFGWMMLAALVVAVIMGWLHIKNGWHDHADDIAEMI